MREEFADLNLTYSIGGQISFDVFPQVQLGPFTWAVRGRSGARLLVVQAWFDVAFDVHSHPSRRVGIRRIACVTYRRQISTRSTSSVTKLSRVATTLRFTHTQGLLVTRLKMPIQ